ncbi:MAG: hypothetical protein HOL55_09475 [Nitrospina sp.]|jgi:hypothetical protein|nr:hypothetical protein [Nitrospina sp.]
MSAKKKYFTKHNTEAVLDFMPKKYLKKYYRELERLTGVRQKVDWDVLGALWFAEFYEDGRVISSALPVYKDGRKPDKDETLIINISVPDEVRKNIDHNYVSVKKIEYLPYEVEEFAKDFTKEYYYKEDDELQKEKYKIWRRNRMKQMSLN